MKKNLLSLFMLACCFMHAQTTPVLFGVTATGGTYNEGVLFYYNPATGILTKKHDFANGSTDGGVPVGSLLKATNGKLYGLTSQGGGFNHGTLFSYNPSTNAYTTLYQFDGGSQGSEPYGSLMQASNGKLYGMTSAGGFGYGNIFEFDVTSNSLTNLISFMSSNDGNSPWGTQLVQATDGKLYGLTWAGGGLGYGELFQFSYSPLGMTNKVAFDFSTTGSQAFGSLMQASNGKLYGMNSFGGANTNGTFFQYDLTTSTLTKKFDFDGTLKGSAPHGDMMQATDGMLYGLTSGGGTNGDGVLFQYNTSTSSYVKKYDFTSASGTSPEGSLRQATNGKLYGLTGSGGANSLGTLFEYNPTTSVLTKKIDFNSTNGSGPQFTTLTEANVTIAGIEEAAFDDHFSLFPNPGNGKFTLITTDQNFSHEGTVEIYSTTGALVFSSDMKSGTRVIDLSSFAKGVYFLRILQNDKMFSTKVISE